VHVVFKLVGRKEGGTMRNEKALVSQTDGRPFPLFCGLQKEMHILSPVQGRDVLSHSKWKMGEDMSGDLRLLVSGVEGGLIKTRGAYCRGKNRVL